VRWQFVAVLIRQRGLRPSNRPDRKNKRQAQDERSCLALSKLCVPDRIRFGIPQPTEWQRIGNEIDAAMIFTRTDFVKCGELVIAPGQRLAEGMWFCGLDARRDRTL
jgi:hypothetical protein